MMSKQAVRYAIIRFRPFVETEEFANIGVVLVAPASNFLDFRLQNSNLQRLFDFFDTVDAGLIRQTVHGLTLELCRIRQLVGTSEPDARGVESARGDKAQMLFDSLVKEREGILRFSDVRYALADDPDTKLDELFAFYVERASKGQQTQSRPQLSVSRP